MNIDYRALTQQAFNDMLEEFPMMSTGEILYSILRKGNIDSSVSTFCTSWIKDIDEKHLYEAISDAIEFEKED